MVCKVGSRLSTSQHGHGKEIHAHHSPIPHVMARSQASADQEISTSSSYNKYHDSVNHRHRLHTAALHSPLALSSHYQSPPLLHLASRFLLIHIQAHMSFRKCITSPSKCNNRRSPPAGSVGYESRYQVPYSKSKFKIQRVT